LPAETDYGVKEFPEISTWLFSDGQWRATITSYDALYHKTKPVQQATGGALSLLYHRKVGLLFAASMARYIIVEKNNQQIYDGEEFALTPRLEVFKNGVWYTNLYDLEAVVDYSVEGRQVSFKVNTDLTNESRETLSSKEAAYRLNYSFFDNKIEIRASKQPENYSKKRTKATLVLPIVSENSEKVVQSTSKRIEIMKPNGKVIIESNIPLGIKETKRKRVFILVPGVEAVPVVASFSEEHDSVSVNIWVE
jgi:hypothetical protein